MDRELLDLIWKIERNPRLYLGDKSCARLFFFLSGYCAGKGWRSPLTGFREWLAQRYGDLRSLNWQSLLEENEADGKSTDAFFRMLRLYLEEAKAEE